MEVAGVVAQSYEPTLQMARDFAISLPAVATET